ncbi:MAG: DUF523 and DUF1722 domain-containing protein [Planctomycetota bacterium]|nr:DUF523 and DUF1722 domain-containing protein [Planctomycetota bacterium]
MSFLMALSHGQLDTMTAPGLEPPEELTVRVGVSTCLLGENVRINGGHCRNTFLVEDLGKHVTWRPVCPEVEVGMSIPRPPMRLVRKKADGPEAAPELVMSKTGESVHERMAEWSEARLDKLAHDDLDGYVFKKDSPTCGMERVKVYDDNGMPTKSGVGIWAGRFKERFPLLPTEEEGRLNDPRLRENFVLRIYTHARWRSLLENDPTPGGLVRFHTAHKMLLLAHNQQQYRELGRIVARAGADPWDEIATAYGDGLMRTLAHRPNRGRHLNTLQHLAGFLRPHLSDTHRQELHGLFATYRKGVVPLVVPLTMLCHHLRTHNPHEWAEQQVYLRPYPEELLLRNIA